jgi:hypothetical protein
MQFFKPDFKMRAFSVADMLGMHLKCNEDLRPDDVHDIGKY